MEEARRDPLVLELSATLLAPSGRACVNLSKLADFVLGLLTIDILGDDAEELPREQEPDGPAGKNQAAAVDLFPVP